MSDLRLRIAAVIYRASGHSDPEWSGRTADAVIRELGVEQESFEDGYLTRYVTPWKIADE